MDRYTDPWVAQSPRRVNQVTERAARDIRERTETHFRASITAWASRDDGQLPTRAQAHDQARAELEILCRGLGRWAALRPEEVFPPDAREWGC